MVQSRVQEQEAMKEMISEREVEIEKFVDLAYRRDGERATTWPVSSLVGPVSICHQFYPLSEFSLAGRPSLSFDSDLYVSKNYFDKTLAGDRRIKNVVIVLDWVVGPPEREKNSPLLLNVAQEDSKLLDMALDWLTSEQSLPGEEPSAFLTRKMSSNQLKGVLQNLLSADPCVEDIELLLKGRDSLPVSEVRSALLDGTLWRKRPNRFFVALSLAEAETIRRFMHVRADGGQKLFLSSDSVSVALRNTTADFGVLDASLGHLQSVGMSAKEDIITGETSDALSPPVLSRQYSHNTALLMRSLKPYRLHFQEQFASAAFAFLDCRMFCTASELRMTLRSVDKVISRNEFCYFITFP
jgi:hypothetical protein